MKNKNIKRVLGIVLSIMLIMSNIAYADTANTAPAKYNDIVGNKYELQIREWITNGFIKGYPDGTFKPENQITRAEFMALVNRAFGFVDTTEINYSDINNAAWYYKEAAKATKAGFIKGDNGRLLPLNNISRQEIAMILARLTNNESSTADEVIINKLADAKLIPTWSKAVISAGLKKGFFEGFADNSFKPAENITRLEAVVALDRALKSMYKAAYTTKGEYGPATGMQILDGDVAVIAPDVTLKNTTINGNLILRETIGEGNVTLDNVVVKGETIVKGGGANSIVINNSTLGKVVVIKEGNTVRIVATGSTNIDNVNVAANAKLEEYQLTGTGFNDVLVLDDIPAGANVIFVGNFDVVGIDSPNININMLSGTIGSLNLDEAAINTNINLGKNATVTTMTLDAAANVTGTGTIGTANINASGTKIEQNPTTVNLTTGVDATVGGKPATPAPPPAAGGGNGGGAPPVTPSITIRNIDIVNATTVTFISDVAGATIKWNGVALSAQSVNGKNTITVPLMESGKNNTLTVEKQGYTAFRNSNLVYTAPYDSIATLSEWAVDRTAPKSWTVEDGWITHTTSSQKAADSWYDWQGKGTLTNVGATDQWKVETKIELTEELLNGTGVRTSMWVEVDGVNSAPGTQKNVLDWTILQFKNDPASSTKGWESWDSTTGAWLPITNITAAKGTYTLTMIYENGKMSQYINGILVREYNIETDEGFGDVSAPSYLIIQSRTFGQEYTAKWKVPTVNYVNKYPANAKFISNITELNDAIADQEDGQTWFIKEGTYDIPKNTVTLRDSNGLIVSTGGQAGWYMPITANNLTIIGIDNPIITSSTFTSNGSWASQNLITVWGDNVTLKGLTIQPKVEENKTIEVVGNKQFTIEDCIFTPNTIAADAIANEGGSLYFNGSGTTGSKAILIKDNTFNYTPIVFDGVEGNDITIVDNTFENISGYAIGNTYWGSEDRKTTQYADVNVSDNKFNNVTEGTKIIAARLNQTFILDEDNMINDNRIDKDDFGKYINFNNLTYWPECKDNKVIVDGVPYESPYKDIDAYAATTQQLISAIINAKAGDTILVANGTYELDRQIRIDKAINIIGEGDSTVITKGSTPWTNATGSKGYASLITIISGDGAVKLENIKVTGAANIAMTGAGSGTDYGSGINIVSSSNVILNNVTSTNNAAAGLIVNSSTVTANNLNTSGNRWYGINVDKKASGSASFTLIGTSAIEEKIQIISDKTVDVIVDAAGYDQYSLEGTTITIWNNKHPENMASITKDNATKYYPTIQAAVKAAVEGDTVFVAEGTYNESIEITKPIKLIGAGIDKTILNAKDDTSWYVLSLGRAGAYGDDLSGTIIEGFTINTPTKVAMDITAIYLTAQGSADNKLIIRNNKFVGQAVKETQQGVGILTPYSDNIGYAEITDNDFINVKYGMYFNSINNTLISGNTIDDTKYAGIIIAGDGPTINTENIEISNNTLTNISWKLKSEYSDPMYDSGICVGMYAENITIKDNSISMLNDKLEMYIAERTITITPSSGEATVAQGGELASSNTRLSSNYDKAGLKTFISLKQGAEAVNFNTVFSSFNLSTAVGDGAFDGPYNMNGASSTIIYGPSSGFSIETGVDQITTLTGEVSSTAPVGVYTIITEVKDGDIVMANAVYTLTITEAPVVSPETSFNVEYYTGIDFSRSDTPIVDSQNGKVVNQEIKEDGSLEISITSPAGTYLDAGFVMNVGTLGELGSITVQGTGEYGLNLYFDLNGDGFFSWNDDGTFVSVGGDAYALYSGPYGNEITINASSIFGLQNQPSGDQYNYTLEQLKAKYPPETPVGIWIGVTRGGSEAAGTTSAIINSVQY